MEGNVKIALNNYAGGYGYSWNIARKCPKMCAKMTVGILKGREPPDKLSNCLFLKDFVPWRVSEQTEVNCSLH